MLYNHTFWAELAPWDKYYSDVQLIVDHVLTEPLCPTATVKFELSRCPIQVIASSNANTIEDAIQDAVKCAVEKLSIWKHLTLEEILEMKQEERDKNYLNIVRYHR
jgi:hypothetical protein